MIYYSVYYEVLSRKVISIKATDKNPPPEISPVLENDWALFSTDQIPKEDWNIIFGFKNAVPGRCTISQFGKFEASDAELQEALDDETGSKYSLLVAEGMAILRAQRNFLLSQSDWTQLSDAPLTDEKKAEWVTYRQALRDLPESTVNPYIAVWPSQP